MDALLIKIFATALAFSQVVSTPDSVKTKFDPVQDLGVVRENLRAGCTHMRKAFDIEDLNLDDLIETALDDPQAVVGEIKAFHGLNFTDLRTSYEEFCKGSAVASPAIDLGEVITFYNGALADLPDHTKLKGSKPLGMASVLDRKGQPFAEVFDDKRRIWAPLVTISKNVQNAFVAAEDKRFYQHGGIDERGLIRAFIANLARPGRPQGGSTITQQVAKNLLVGDDVSYERKIREMIVASRIEQTLSKAEILELYLNSIYLGRASWGVELAARSYFGKSTNLLTLEEAALLAGLAKGPNFYNPDRYPDRVKERVSYVLARMQEDSFVSAETAKLALAREPTLIKNERARRTDGLHFVDQVGRELKTLTAAGTLPGGSYTVRSTILPDLQKAAEIALRDGLVKYEASAGRIQFQGPEMNLADAVKRAQAEQKAGSLPAWQIALQTTRLPLFDVNWTPAVILENFTGGKNAGATLRVGLKDGRTMPLNIANAATRRSLTTHDVVYVRVVENRGKGAARAELRIRPTVQGAAIVLENKTGGILATVGSSSYGLSQLNRASQAQRQPGSTLKPLTYLAALLSGLQPNTLVLDEPITLAPISGEIGARERDYWTPRNADHSSLGVLTLRRALENSRNLVTARLLDGAIEGTPERSLQRVCDLAREAQLYKECVPFYPFVLGAQPVRPIDLAAFYAAIANEGLRPAPHTIDAIEQDGRLVYRHSPTAATRIGSADPASVYQLKTILQGVLQRGTARSIRHLAPYVAGKTGTTDDVNDAWFVGFTNDVTIAVWVGYDNADGKRRTLGAGQTGASVAIPIFEPILQAAWQTFAPKTALAPPSPEAKRQLVALAIDLNSGDRVERGSGGMTEYFHLDSRGRVDDTQYKFVSRAEALDFRDPGGRDETYAPFRDPYQDNYPNWRTYPDNRYPDYRYPDNRYDNRVYNNPNAPRQPPQVQQQPQPWRGFFSSPWQGQERVAPPPQPQQQQRRVDPDYFFGDRRPY